MQKLFLLSQNRFSVNVTKWLFSIWGLSLLVNGITVWSEPSLTKWSLVTGTILVLSGIVMSFYGLNYFFPKSPLVTKLVIGAEEIMIKKDFHLKAVTINWNDIAAISFRSYDLEVLLKDNTKLAFQLQTGDKTNQAIKKSLQEVAEVKSINFAEV